MIIRGIKVRILTPQGEFGFREKFSEGLTIVRGNNSSGKSTFINSILYGLGMEELIGGKGEKVLPYALKDRLSFDGQDIPIVSSEVYLEVRNKEGKVVTIRRAIKDDSRSSKLAEIFWGSLVVNGDTSAASEAMYLHDAGSAQQEAGFFLFLERFMGLNLPSVSTTSNSDAKLYLQTVFAAFFVEQKRGWTDYIATIPFYGIREARVRVVEYLLALNVFENSAKKSKLDRESIEISSGWDSLLREVRRIESELAISVVGVPERASSSFSVDLVRFGKVVSDKLVPISDYIMELRREYQDIENGYLREGKDISHESLKKLEAAMNDLERVSSLHDSLLSDLAVKKSQLSDILTLINETEGELERNKAYKKLKDLGARDQLSVSNDFCPTCGQQVTDSILDDLGGGPGMDLLENISYLQQQCKMLERQSVGLRVEISRGEASIREVSLLIEQKNSLLNAVRSDISKGNTVSRASVLRQTQIEREVLDLDKAELRLAEILSSLVEIVKALIENKRERLELPQSRYSDSDLRVINYFEKTFRANASSFGYESANVSDIRISHDTLTPFLSGIELRQFKSDIRSDSSASDFVRLIWSYLLSIYQTSSRAEFPGNHIGLLVFDEPGQHSMAASSQHELIRQLSSQDGLQAIVAASFDESEAVFREATEGVTFDLISWDGKLVKKV